MSEETIDCLSYNTWQTLRMQHCIYQRAPPYYLTSSEWTVSYVLNCRSDAGDVYVYVFVGQLLQITNHTMLLSTDDDRNSSIQVVFQSKCCVEIRCEKIWVVSTSSLARPLVCEDTMPSQVFLLSSNQINSHKQFFNSNVTLNLQQRSGCSESDQSRQG